MTKRIIYNLEDFAKALVDFISDGSKAGQKRLLKVFQKASQEYNKPKDSVFWSWIYSFTRQRAASFERAISELQTFPDPIIRLQEFQKFVSEGEWKITSANTVLFLFLIRAIKGYKNESDHYLHEVVIPPLRDLILKDINLLVTQQEIAEKQAEIRKQELQAMREGKNKEMAGIFLFDSPERAKEFAIKNPGKQAFHLVFTNLKSNDPRWGLTWYDLTGKPNSLQVEGELKSLLEKLENNILPEDGSTRQFKIKSECTKLVEELLNKTQVLINPNTNKLTELTSTYVVSQQSTTIQLDWYDSLGKKYPLTLKNYPALNAWITGKTEFSKADLFRLKTYLGQVKIRREVDEVKQANIHKILQEKHGVALIAADDLKKIPPYKLIVGTYLLTREPATKTGAWVLYQRQKGGINQRIDTDDWELFHETLAKNDDILAGSLTLGTKNALRDCIKKSDSISQKNKTFCKAINQFSLASNEYYKPCTFIVTKQDRQWQLFYVDILQKIIKVDLKKCPDNAATLFKQWSGEPEALGQLRLNELAKALANYKPAAQLDLTNFSELERCLSKRTPNKADAVITHSLLVDNLNENTSAEKKLGKLDIASYAMLENCLAAKLSSAKLKTEFTAELAAIDLRKTEPVGKKPGKLDIDNYAVVESCLADRLSSAKPKTDISPILETININETESVKKEPGKLNVSNYAVASLFGHKLKTETKEVFQELPSPN